MAALAFSLHSFGQYQIEVLVETLDQIKYHPAGILGIDNNDWLTDLIQNDEPRNVREPILEYSGGMKG